MSGYIDIHAHILYGIDDGPADRAGSEAMLLKAAESGTTVIAATPHLRPDFPDVHPRQLADRADELRVWIAGHRIPIELVNGGELGLVWALDANDDELRLCSYGQRGTDLLVETPATTVGMEALLYQIRARGFRITLAHPERSREFQRNPDALEALVQRGVLLQVNADGLLGNPRKSPTCQLAQHLCRVGLVHALATDSHRASAWRPVSSMPAAVAAAAELVGPERAEWMAAQAPAAIVAGLPLPEPPPIFAPRRRRRFSRG